MPAAEIMTPEFRAGWVAVFAPQENTRDDGTKSSGYSLVAIFSKDADLSKLKAAAQALLVEKFGPDQTKWPTINRNPFRKCREKWKNEGGKQIIPAGYEDGDATFMTFQSKVRPGVVDENVQVIIDTEKFYSGLYARAYVRPYYYGDKPHHKGNRGVGFGLQRVQKIRNGDPLGGRSAPEAGFAAVEGAGSSSAASVFD